MANDTHANILLNLLMREYGCLPDEYRIVGFDDWYDCLGSNRTNHHDWTTDRQNSI